MVVSMSIEGFDGFFGVFTALVLDESKATRLSRLQILGLENKIKFSASGMYSSEKTVTQTMGRKMQEISPICPNSVLTSD
jgi:hypothetical protein